MAYAVGEIVLIVVGIMIALEINNLNEERKLEQERVKLIENLQSDFQTKQLRLEEMIPRYENRIQEMERFLKAVTNEGDPLSVEDMKRLFSHFHRSIRFVPVLGSYMTSLSTGTISLIDSPSLNEFLIEFEGYHKRLEDLRSEYRTDVFSGKSSENRDQIGSLWQLWENDSFQPEMFKLSDAEYRAFVSQKHVYSGFENKFFLTEIMLSELRNLLEKTEQILHALESL